MSNHTHDIMAAQRSYNVLIGVTGSVATVKLPELVTALKEKLEPSLQVITLNIRFICSSKAALHFVERSEEYNPENWNKFTRLYGGFDLMITDDDEWGAWERMGDPVVHIALRRWADLLVVAPASADLLSKAACGISDNLLLCVMRAWNFEKPCVLCPAMNTHMWYHPSTETSISILSKWGFDIVMPVEKVLACNDVGNGALAPIETIVGVVEKYIRLHQQRDTAATAEENKLLFEVLKKRKKVKQIVQSSHSTSYLVVHIFIGMVLYCCISKLFF